MPVEFLTDDEAAAYGQYAGAPSQADLERVFFLDDDDRVLVGGIAGRSADDEDRLARTAGPSAAFEGLSPFGQREGLADHPSQPSRVGRLRQLG